MNIIRGFKTLAVTMPFVLSPMKSTAQTVVKESKALATQVAKNGVTLNGNIGAGYGFIPFMHKGVAEPKVYGSLGIANESIIAAIETSLGKSVQSYGARVGAPIGTSTPNLNMETGMFFRQNCFRKSNDIPGIVLKSEVESAKNNCVERHLGTVAWGAYFKPSYKIGKANLHANVEGGLAGVTGGIRGSKTVSGEALEQIVANGNMVDRPSVTLAAKVGVGADVEVAKNVKVGGDYTYSTYDKHSGFSLKAVYNFCSKNLRKALKK